MIAWPPYAQPNSLMGGSTADPGQNPRGAPDLMPLWTIFDDTPEGRGGDWYPELEYGKKAAAYCG